MWLHNWVSMLGLPTIIIGCALAPSACTLTAVDTSCTSFGPLTYSAKNDTADTVLQVRRHNAAWDAICK